MTELREMRGDRAADYSRLENDDDVLNLKIKTLDDSSCWEIEAEGSWTVRQLKDRLKEEYKLEGKRLRLIVLGRMLEDSNTLSSYGLKDNDFVHAAISDDVAPSPDVAIDINRREGRARVAVEADDGHRGFDRLLQAGFSQAEVDFLRAQFHARRGHMGRPLTEAEAVELEEEWLEQNQEDSTGMNLGGGRDARRLDRVMEEVAEGTQADMFLGLVMGFVFGIIMLFWIWERGIPRRQKLGILCGIGCNLTMGMIRLQTRGPRVHASSSSGVGAVP
mmetsp:Transcript_6910/g.13683  ORF Transcript_6910/g.13683 Transcript_6910/m.13683 type:complete len:276 (+) Transcript_6910:303-1130(+)